MLQNDVVDGEYYRVYAQAGGYVGGQATAIVTQGRRTIHSQGEQALYGRIEFRDDRDRVALLRVVAVPAAAGQVSLLVEIDENILEIGESTAAQTQVLLSESGIAGARVSLEIDGP